MLHLWKASHILSPHLLLLSTISPFLQKGTARNSLFGCAWSGQPLLESWTKQIAQPVDHPEPLGHRGPTSLFGGKLGPRWPRGVNAHRHDRKFLNLFPNTDIYRHSFYFLNGHRCEVLTIIYKRDCSVLSLSVDRVLINISIRDRASDFGWLIKFHGATFYPID